MPTLKNWILAWKLSKTLETSFNTVFYRFLAAYFFSSNLFFAGINI